jgi:Domain of unknown function (DUF1707)
MQPSQPGDDPYGHVLASDAERESTVEQLRVAHADGRLTMDEMADRSGIAYQARTAAELSRLTSDLPSIRPGTALPVTVGDEVRDSFIAVFSGSERKGHWRVPRRSKAVAVFGGIALDLRQAEFSAHDVYLELVVVFGGVEINVPEGVDVHLSGWAAFGGKSANVPPARPGAPVLHIHCNIAFGGLEVNAKPLPYDRQLEQYG